jgi:hypothetical protein
VDELLAHEADRLVGASKAVQCARLERAPWRPAGVHDAADSVGNLVGCNERLLVTAFGEEKLREADGGQTRAGRSPVVAADGIEQPARTLEVAPQNPDGSGEAEGRAVEPARPEEPPGGGVVQRRQQRVLRLGQVPAPQQRSATEQVHPKEAEQRAPAVCVGPHVIPYGKRVVVIRHHEHPSGGGWEQPGVRVDQHAVGERLPGERGALVRVRPGKGAAEGRRGRQHLGPGPVALDPSGVESGHRPLVGRAERDAHQLDRA